MGKVRIFQIAEELKIDNKELVSRLRELGYEVKSHMSSFDEEAVAEIKEKVEAQKRSEMVETRVSSGVVRRRAMKRVPEPPKPEEAVEPPAEPEPAAPPPAEEPAEPLAAPAEAPPAEVAEPPPTVGEPEEKRPEVAAEAKVAAPVEPGVKPSPPAIKKEDEAEAEAKKKKGKRRVREATDLYRDEVPYGRKPIPAWQPPGGFRRRRKGGGPAYMPYRTTKKKVAKREARRTEITVRKASKRVIRISNVIFVGDLAKQLGVKGSELIRKLMDLGVMATLNQSVDFDTAALIAHEYEYEIENVAFQVRDVIEVEADKKEQLVLRPPIVTVMGHVDHGKTSLLDAIRETNVAGAETGEITQHIGAYKVSLPNGNVVFLDTPGHEAFTALRARGAKVTDAVVLVVAADDGVMPQTLEAVDHARAAEVPIIVAINKIDKPGADPEKIKKRLGELQLIPEEWGGSTIYAQVSAKKRTGINELLELILLQAEVLELRANPDRRAEGVVIEAKLDRGHGPVATVLVQRGTLRVGDPIVTGVYYGRVRALLDDHGEAIEKAGPSTPVEVLGLSGVPEAGDSLVAVEDERGAKRVAEHRMVEHRENELAKTSRVSLEDLHERIRTADVKELRIIIKADAQGSVEALSDSLQKLSTGEVKLRVIHGGVGAITESDVMLASASQAVVVGFNVRPQAHVDTIAMEEGVDIELYEIIYDAVNEVRKAMEGLLEPRLVEHVLGRADVKETFNISKIGTVAGSIVSEGKIARAAYIRLLRDDVVVHKGKLGSLRRFKNDVRDVSVGLECGIGIENYNDIKIGDVIEAFEVEKVTPKLE